MVRRVGHYNGVKYVPSTTNNPFSERQSYEMIRGKGGGGGDPTDLLMPNVTVLSVTETFPALNVFENAMVLVTKKRAQKLTPEGIAIKPIAK